MTKYIFVTGGVVSSLGKGITAASLARLLKNRGLNVTIQKFDPYINIDPGTMSPYQHGEVFVTDDGAETDLDLGHYERFIDINLSQNANVTSGRIYSTVLKKSAVAIITAERFKSFRISRTRLKTASSAPVARRTQTSSSQRLVEQSGTSSRFRSSRPFVK